MATRGYEGDDGPALSALLGLSNVANDCDPGRFEQASHIALDRDGNLFLADSRNQRIRKVVPGRNISTVAGGGDVPVENIRCGANGPFRDGSASNARFYNPSGVLPLENGDLMVADQGNNRIRKITADGVVTTIAGNGLHNIYAPGIPATASPMDWPIALAADSKGVVHFVELHGNRVGRLDANGRMTTVAGNGFPGSSGDGGLATRATLNRPVSLAFDADGNLYIADTGNHRIRKVAVNGVITTFAGNGRSGFCGDEGPAKDACLNSPMDVKPDRLGNVFIADTRNHRIRRVDSAGVITTIAGTGEAGKGEEQVAPLESALDSPSSLAVDNDNNLFILDWQNYRIRRLDFKGVVPAVQDLVNAASLTGPVSPGSAIAILGTGLTNSLGETTVSVDGKAIVLSATAPDRLAGVLPEDLAVGTVNAVVTAGPYTGREFAVEVVAAAPGLYPKVLNEDGAANSPENRSTGGRIVSCVLTGLGRASELGPPTAWIADVVAEVVSITAQAEVPGTFVVTIRLPNDAPAGDAVPLVIEIEGRRSNAVPVAVESVP